MSYMPGNSIEASTLAEAERLARQNPDTKIKVRHPPAQPPNRYERSRFPHSIPEGANAVYRTSGPKEHFQLRVYDDYWTVDFDEYHPEHYPVQHAVVDSPKYTAMGALIVAAITTQG